MGYRADKSPVRINIYDVMCAWILLGVVLVLLAMTELALRRDLFPPLRDTTVGPEAALVTRQDALHHGRRTIGRIR
jgi:hypothetical protein